MTNISWIKITTDIFNDEKILLIESMAPEHDAVIVIWFKLLTLAGRTNNNGVFMINDRLAYTPEMLATIFRRPEKTVRLALEIFESLGMIEIINDIITIPNWEKHQNTEALDKTREKTRQRVAAFREKQKRLAHTESSQNDVNVTTDAALPVTLPVTLRNAAEKREEKKEEKNILERERREERREENNNMIPPPKEPSAQSVDDNEPPPAHPPDELPVDFTFSNAVKEECLSEIQECHKTVFDRWVGAGLPLSRSSAQSYFTFSCRELKLALGYWQGKKLSPEEILEALGNYIALAGLIRSGKSWMDNVGGFDYFAKHTIDFLDGNFQLDRYQKRTMQDGKAFDKDEEARKVAAMMAEMGIVENH